MSRMRRPHTISIPFLILLALLGAVPSLVFAQGGSIAMPENARAKSHGSGWECDQGYRETNGTCAAIKAPENAYPTNTAYGRGWHCGRGYRQVDETCVAITVPSNAYPDASRSDRWICDRGYRADKGTCVALNVPANAYLDYSGNDWDCNQPYRRGQAGCAQP
jgi:hypothetical protein